MSKDRFTIEGYLERIDYKGSLTQSEETLYQLHTGHSLHIPFENLDVYYGKPIYLDRESLYKKIVEGKRGGYCFEMNGLLYNVLKELGFKVANSLARVTKDNGITYKAKTHQVLIVQIGHRYWLLDVGYGNNGLAAPVLIEPGREQQQFYNTFRIIEEERLGYVLQIKKPEGYSHIYAFSLEDCNPEDITMSNHFTSTFPESLFVNKKICTMPTSQGRIILTDDHFKIWDRGEIFTTKVQDDEQYNHLLREYFKLDINDIM